MVFTSLLRFAAKCNRGPEEFWRKRKIFRMAAHFKNRKQNCYGLAIRGVHRALQYATIGREQKREDLLELWTTRLEGASQQFSMDHKTMTDGLSKCEIFINRKALSDLASWEPRTFEALAKVALTRVKYDGNRKVANVDLPTGVISRGMIK